MSKQSITVEAVFQNGVLHPSKPLPLKAKQKVTVTVQLPATEKLWPENTEEIYRELAEEDKRLANQMLPLVMETWPHDGD